MTESQKSHPERVAINLSTVADHLAGAADNPGAVFAAVRPPFTPNESAEVIAQLSRLVYLAGMKPPHLTMEEYLAELAIIHQAGE